MMRVEKKHRFSLAYRLWERKTLRDFRRGCVDKNWTLRKARYAVAALTAALSLLIGGTAYAAVVLFGRYGFVDKVDYSKLLLENHPSDKTTIEELYGLPEEDGWELIDYNIDPTCSTLFYQRGDVKVSFDQSTIHNGNMGHINTGKADAEMLSLYSENDGFVLEFENSTLIYWLYDGYLLKIYGNIDKNKAINLTYSTKIVNFPKNF
ncbi:MAG: hypothetical protein NC299_16075 [Lachnospiraceae bacterium]|nr:hypothetical protein [Ruminococcus sp.]MCM1276853.1 hypothetical protein [Lachnospiraceae bacterium]